MRDLLARGRVLFLLRCCLFGAACLAAARLAVVGLSVCGGSGCCGTGGLWRHSIGEWCGHAGECLHVAWQRADL